jgi:hypothetical protein
MARWATPKVLDGFEVGEIVLCGTDRHPRKWKISRLKITWFASRLMHLADLTCVEVAASGGSTYQNRVGMMRMDVSLSHLTKTELTPATSAEESRS